MPDGFILDENRWDSLPLDDLLLPQIHKQAQGRLGRAGYLGFDSLVKNSSLARSYKARRNYTLSREGVCYRTQVAVRTQTLGNKDWQKFVQGKENEVQGERDESKADAYITTRILNQYADEARKALARLAQYATSFPEYHRSILTKRWTQIEELVKEAYDNSINVWTREALVDI